MAQPQCECLLCRDGELPNFREERDDRFMRVWEMDVKNGKELSYIQLNARRVGEINSSVFF
jgi:hypothetical protein